MPVFTPGSNTQRLPTAVVTERVVIIFFYHSARKNPKSQKEVLVVKFRAVTKTHLFEAAGQLLVEGAVSC